MVLCCIGGTMYIEKHNEGHSIDGYRTAIILKQVGFEICAPLYGFGPSIRDYYLCHYVIEGKGRVEYEDQQIYVKAGEIFLIRPDERTYYQADREKPWTYYWIAISGDEAKRMVYLMGFRHKRRVLQYEQDNKSIIATMHKMTIARMEQVSNQLEEMSDLYKVIGLIRRNYEQSEWADLDTTQEINKYVRLAVDYIHKRYMLDLHIHEVAKYVGMDRTQLYRLFMTTFDCGPKAYLINLRMEQARKFLRTTQWPIKEVAFSVGYQDPYLFSKIFKNQQGLSPKNYRNL